MCDDGLDFDAAYAVLEDAREFATSGERETLNEAHAIVQEFEQWTDDAPADEGAA